MIEQALADVLVAKYREAGCTEDMAERLVAAGIQAHNIVEEARAAIVEAALERVDDDIAPSLGLLVIQLEINWLQWCLREITASMPEMTVQ